MILAEEQPIACPGCSAPSTFRIQWIVDADREPAVATALLEGSLFAFRCPSCGHVARVVHPELRYVDRAHDLLVQLDASATFDAKTEADLGALPARTRIVRDGNALLEKAKIARAGLDDRVVEALKLVARGTLGPQAEGKRILFEAAETERLRFTILGRDGTIAGLGVPRSSYDGLATDLAKHGRLLEPGAFAVVDEVIAQAMLKP